MIDSILITIGYDCARTTKIELFPGIVENKRLLEVKKVDRLAML